MNTIVAVPPRKPRYRIKDGKIIDTTVKPVEIAKPHVYFTNRVLRAIDHIVARCDQEVAWLGLVDKIEDDALEDDAPAYLVSEIFIPKQIVTGSTVDIDKEEMAMFVNWLMENNHDVGKLRYHGHSHVNMQTNPSGVDNDYIEDQLEHVPFFIRSIHNKKREHRVDVFDRDNGIMHQNVYTDNWDTLESAEFYDNLNTLIDRHVTKPARPEPQRFGQPSPFQRPTGFSWADRERQAELDEIWQYHLDHPEKGIREYLDKVKGLNAAGDKR